MRGGGQIVFVAVGANLGDREATFAAVIRAIEAEPDLLLLAASPVLPSAGGRARSTSTSSFAAIAASSCPIWWCPIPGRTSAPS